VLLEGGHDGTGDLVLYNEDVDQLPVVGLGPEVIALVGLDELGGDAHAVAGPAHASLQDVADAELTGDVAGIRVAPLEREGRGARRDLESGHLRQQVEQQKDDIQAARNIPIDREQLKPRTEAPSLVDLMRMSYEEWDVWTRGSAIRREGYAGFKRNVAMAIGNWMASADERPEEAVAVLGEALEDEEPLVRAHSAWALGQVGSAGADRIDEDRMAGALAE